MPDVDPWDVTSSPDDEDDDPERLGMLSALCKELPKLPTGALAEVLGYVQETADYWAERAKHPPTEPPPIQYGTGHVVYTAPAPRLMLEED